MRCWKARFALLLDFQVVEERSSVRVNSTQKYFDKTHNNLVVNRVLLVNLAKTRISARKIIKFGRTGEHRHGLWCIWRVGP